MNYLFRGGLQLHKTNLQDRQASIVYIQKQAEHMKNNTLSENDKNKRSYTCMRVLRVLI